jgi:hypothetical protein
MQDEGVPDVGGGTLEEEVVTPRFGGGEEAPQN